MIIGVILRGFDGVEPVTRTSDSDSDHDEGRPATFGFRPTEERQVSVGGGFQSAQAGRHDGEGAGPGSSRYSIRF